MNRVQGCVCHELTTRKNRKNRWVERRLSERMGRDIARAERVDGERREVHHTYSEFSHCLFVFFCLSVCLSIYNELAVLMIKRAAYKTPPASDDLVRLFYPTVSGCTIPLSFFSTSQRIAWIHPQSLSDVVIDGSRK